MNTKDVESLTVPKNSKRDTLSSQKAVSLKIEGVKKALVNIFGENIRIVTGKHKEGPYGLSNTFARIENLV